MTDMIRPSLDLRIEELALHGFAHSDHYQIGEAVERELVRLFAEQGVPQSLMKGGELPNLSLGSFQVRQGAKTEAIGAQVAQAVYRGESTKAQSKEGSGK